MSNNNAIQIYLRVRPSNPVDPGFKILKEEQKVEFFIPKDADQGYINNASEKWVFNFNRVFDMDTRQEQIFDRLVKDVADSALSGFNGTVFAYGQTGSGKTYTMTGSGEDYNKRGIIPRTIEYMFSKATSKTQENINICISYMQIYRGTGYDLIDPDNKSKNLTDLKKIQPRERDNQIILHNLSVHNPKNIEDALNLLWIGDVNRITSKTPMNDQSTRSHCIFMIRVESSKANSDVKTVATIHLVDLSGSERIKQTKVEGLLEKQARQINLGLHFLQHVITCLNKKSNGENVHVPYRQSLMTMVLRDSIGGNCKTRMVATMSAKPDDIKQSIATCKFSQRVALIKNNLKRNESVEPAVIIERLKMQNAKLKAQLTLLKGADQKQELDKYDIEQCEKKVKQYIENDDPQAALILSDRLMINQCFSYFKKIYKDAIKNGSATNKVFGNESKLMDFKKGKNQSVIGQKIEVNNQFIQKLQQDIKKLKLLVQQKDNQIVILLNMINEKNGKTNQLVLQSNKPQQQNLLLQSIVNEKPMQFRQEKMEKMLEKQEMKSLVQQNKNNSTRNSQLEEIQSMLLKPLNLSAQQLRNHAEAFEQFRRAYRKQNIIKQNQSVMKKKMDQGKEIGKIVNQARDEVNLLKERLEKLRTKMAVESVTGGSNIQQSQMENEILQRMDKCKQVYKINFQRLKNLKTEITAIQNLMKKNAENLQKDFEKYISFYTKEREQSLKNVQPSIIASSIQDKDVQKHLESFFKARDEIRKR